jgi:GNAT superfamily N-acetyltransferase
VPPNHSLEAIGDVAAPYLLIRSPFAYVTYLQHTSLRLRRATLILKSLARRPIEKPMVQELIYPSNELPAHLKCQILSFLRIVWPEGFVGENRLRDWISRDENHPVSVMLVEQDILISHTEVVWKYLAHAGEIYKVYGLTGVFTYPAFRGQGYGKQIVERGTACIDASDAHIGIFHCAPNLKEFYAACGWIPMENAVTLVGSKNNPQVSNELTMMRFLTEKGKRGRPAFEGIPLYFGEDTW